MTGSRITPYVHTRTEGDLSIRESPGDFNDHVSSVEIYDLPTYYSSPQTSPLGHLPTL